MSEASFLLQRVLCDVLQEAGGAAFWAKREVIERLTTA